MLDHQQAIRQLLIRAADAHERGELSSAASLCQEALQIEPSNAWALNLLGWIWHRGGRAQGIDLMRRSVNVRPSESRFYGNLAAALGDTGRLEEAVQVLRAGLERHPDDPVLLGNLGISLGRLGLFRQSLEPLRRAAEQEPLNAKRSRDLGDALSHCGKLGDAIEAYQLAIERDPACAGAHNNLAHAAELSGNLSLMIDAFTRAAELAPGPITEGNLIYALHYLPGLDASVLFRRHLAWAARWTSGLVRYAHDHSWDAEGERLRVGYVSADFREHTRARFVEPLLEQHDRERFDVFLYSDVSRPDAVTRRLEGFGAVVRRTAGYSDSDLAELIYGDRVQILVDLTGHMGRNRLMAFAQRPAPVQVSWPGYPDTTGMRGVMDYIVVDEGRAPASAEARYAEQLVRLPVTSQCYRPTDIDLKVGDAPAVRNGYTTFASLNKAVKVNDEVVNVWSHILGRVAGAKLSLLAGPDAERTLRARFSALGVTADRLEFARPRSRRAYLELYKGVDVNLDPWPYNGHTTTLDGFWMGVPTVCLDGDRHAAREGSAICRILGLDDLVARSVDEYVDAAARLAFDATRIASLRSSLRPRLTQSPLFDSDALARRMEEAYLRMWRAHREGVTRHA